ncbi:MAG: hypothetical protein IKR66_07280 [Bacteroidales bacterium]|nr:hypothetical protein [Bacteroidales bacterium]
MESLSVVLFAIGIVVCFGLIIKTLVIPMTHTWSKILLLVIIVVIVLLCETLFITTACIPYKTPKLLQSGVSELETLLETKEPGSTSQILSANDIQETLKDVDTFGNFLNEKSKAFFFTRLIGIASYMQYLDTFSGSINENLQEMEDNNIPITLHNIFTQAQQKCVPLIEKATRSLEIIILILTAIILIIIGILCYILSKNEDDLDNPRIYIAPQEN